MSINIVMTAIREVVSTATGRKSVQRVDIPVWQTPTDVTYQIIKSGNPAKAYAEWAKNLTGDEEIPIESDGDDPVYFNAGRTHAAEFLLKVRNFKHDGFDIVATGI